VMRTVKQSIIGARLRSKSWLFPPDPPTFM
jgi:hypothetical protein